MKIPVILFVFGAFLTYKDIAQTFAAGIFEQQSFQHSEHMNETQNTNSCYLSEKQWELISWYFLNVGTHINVTEIVREMDVYKQTLYMSFFLKELYRYTGLKYFTRLINSNINTELSDEEVPSENNTYIWHPKLSKRGNSTSYIEEDKLNIRQQLLQRNWNREDEPDIGVVVLATDFQIIDQYLNGEIRLPFTAKRAHYVIVIYENFAENWDEWGSSISSKLWKVYGILNVIVLATCKPNNVSWEILLNYL